MGQRIFRAYQVWPRFPSVSMTGEACALDCLHCGREYLKFMTPTATPKALVEFGEHLVAEKNGEGLLVSGGCDAEGRMLNLAKFLPALGKLHELGLIIKLHTGFVDGRMARGIVEAGVDIASMEFVGSNRSIREIFGLDATVEKYVQTFANLRDAGVPYIAPHVCVGLQRGELDGELNALDLLKKTVVPSAIALIAFRPTRGTELESCAPPSAESMGEVAAHARKLFPKTKIILGALRPRGSGRSDTRGAREGLELAALRSGISGAEVPSSAMLAEVRRMGMRVKRIESFGVLPTEYEGRVKWRWDEA
jgi:uncharacterized radical SAM superfamily protein